MMDATAEVNYSHMVARYLPPAAPTLRFTPPRGEQWLHEVKFDSWRIQLHKHGGSAAAFTKNGHDHSSRVRWMVDALACLKGVRSLVIDGELVACDNKGLPDFYALHFRLHDRDLCAWAFDLLHHKGPAASRISRSEVFGLLTRSRGKKQSGHRCSRRAKFARADPGSVQPASRVSVIRSASNGRA
jgi:ATP-dependent DNA ligase